MNQSSSGGKKKPRKGRHFSPGMGPGRIIVDPQAARPSITAFAYGADSLEEHAISDLSEIVDLLERFPVTWINVNGLGDAAILERLGELLGIHRLALEDVVNVPQRPKVESYGEQLFIILQMLGREETLEREQISVCTGARFVVTFQEKPGDPLDQVRERLRSGSPRIRSSGTDYLAYALIDAIIDQYFPFLEEFQERIEELEDDLRTFKPDAVERIRSVRSDLGEIRRTLVPLREVTRTLVTTENPRVTDGTKVYLRDCHDHALAAGELFESCREVASALMDIHLSTMTHQANETMKVLTIIATIFMPLSFIAGIYGMNFNPELPGNMPEVNWPYGYLLVLGGMTGVAVALIVFFRKRGWF